MKTELEPVKWTEQGSGQESIGGGGQHRHLGLERMQSIWGWEETSMTDIRKWKIVWAVVGEEQIPNCFEPVGSRKECEFQVLRNHFVCLFVCFVDKQATGWRIGVKRKPGGFNSQTRVERLRLVMVMEPAECGQIDGVFWRTYWWVSWSEGMGKSKMTTVILGKAIVSWKKMKLEMSEWQLPPWTCQVLKKGQSNSEIKSKS